MFGKEITPGSITAYEWAVIREMVAQSELRIAGLIQTAVSVLSSMLLVKVAYDTNHDEWYTLILIVVGITWLANSALKPFKEAAVAAEKYKASFF